MKEDITSIWINEYGRTVDFVKSIISFNVLEKDVFSSGRQIDLKYGELIFVEHNWKLIGS